VAVILPDRPESGLHHSPAIVTCIRKPPPLALACIRKGLRRLC
jgi:hypothetical protein